MFCYFKQQYYMRKFVICMLQKYTKSPFFLDALYISMVVENSRWIKTIVAAWRSWRRRWACWGAGWRSVAGRWVPPAPTATTELIQPSTTMDSGTSGSQGAITTGCPLNLDAPIFFLSVYYWIPPDFSKCLLLDTPDFSKCLLLDTPWFFYIVNVCRKIGGIQ